MQIAITYKHSTVATKMCLISCILTVAIFGLTVSFHDYLPEHPPTFVLPAEDKLKVIYSPQSVPKAGADRVGGGSVYLYSRSDEHQVAPYRGTSQVGTVSKDDIRSPEGGLFPASDSSPPAA